MTSVFDEYGNNIPCSVIEAGPCYVIQIKNIKKDGYSSIQMGFIDKIKKINTPYKNHFLKSGISPKVKLVEFPYSSLFKLGDKINVSIFKKNELVDIVGITKGKGFQGVVKRHGFSGVGEKTHGQHNRLRAPGSIGAGSDPSRVFKGTKMAGRMGGKNITIKNNKIIFIDANKNLLIVQGSVPGKKNSYIIIKKKNENKII